MEPTSSLCSPVLPHPLQSFSIINSRNRKIIKIPHQKRSSSSTTTSTSRIYATRRDHPSYGWDYNGKLVDESMIVLRMRIHEMKMIEENYEPPSDWMDWEKRYYPTYDSDICEAMEFLQTQLMNTRPSLALGMVALLALSVPTSSLVIIFHLMEIAKWILSVIHLS